MGEEILRQTHSGKSVHSRNVVGVGPGGSLLRRQDKTQMSEANLKNEVRELRFLSLISSHWGQLSSKVILAVALKFKEECSNG